ncbi:hypothetical protein ACVXC9_002918 [Vibrio cholerae]
MSEYQERDLMELDKVGNHYGKHVLAMTREDLRSKSDIAAELGYRDMVINQLTEESKRLREALVQARYLLNECNMVSDNDGLVDDINIIDDLLSEIGGE